MMRMWIKRYSALTLFTRTLCRAIQSDVRVRFAPSPTGHIHLGGLRTALYNFLFARVNAGKFILRVEDTDQSRVVEGASEKIENDLIWAGLQPDESPLQGGPFGPYIQSHRTHLYRKYTNELIELGKAYPCFCSEKRLELVRREAIRMRAIPRYDNHCRNLDKTEVAQKIARGNTYCVRFKLDSEPEIFEDLVYGKVTLNTASIEGDPVIFKADGFPTYHLACVVDDHLMNISHVLRGVEWQVSTSKHLQMHRALGWLPPKFGHLPLLLNVKGAKLSKRHGDIDVDHFRKSGIFSDVLLSFVTEFGGGFKRDAESSSTPSVYNLSELIHQFDFTSINTSSCRVDLDRLKRLNRLKVKERLADTESLQDLIQQLRVMVIDSFKDELSPESPLLACARLATVLQWGLPRMSRLDDFLGPDLKFLWIRPSHSMLVSLSSGTIKLHSDALEWAAQVIERHMSSKETFESVDDTVIISNLREKCSAMDLDFKTLTKLMRAALCGLKSGPPVIEIIHILGPEETICRLRRGAKALQTSLATPRSCEQQ